MGLIELIHPDQIELDVEVASTDALFELIGQRVSEKVQFSAHAVTRALAERETLGSTSVGGGFAIPHCKLDGIDSTLIWLLRGRQGIEFACPHNDRVRFLFVVLSPPDRPALHLRVLGQIARVLKRADVREDLLEAPDAATVQQTLERAATGEGL
jgi:PTS system nitrogen regulatory IIA component